jgi:hypothetical protein
MKQANSTEMDRLLQRHARRWGAAAASGESGGGDGVSKMDGGAHLDADEMNAYAEGALPPAARARYASHLADCGSCRAIVTDLALAAQVASPESRREEPESASPSKSWWSAIVTALFAPPVLRYAVPAVLLLGVIVVALVATRDRSEPQFVAQNEERQADSAATPQPVAPEPSPAQVSSKDSSVAANTSVPTGTTEADQPAQAPPLDGTLQTNANASRTLTAPTNETKPDTSTGPASDSRDREQPNLNDELYAKDPQAAPPPPAMSRPASPSAGKVEEERQNREENTAVTSGSGEASDVGRAGNKETESKKRPAERPALASENAPKQSGASGQPASRVGARRAAKSVEDKGADDKDRADSSTETRSVAGRRFRRQGDAWIDTAYNSSRSTISVARGSDQYRALTADEPSIRTIAEQLGGVVIVVWKGKAYRIH